MAQVLAVVVSVKVEQSDKSALRERKGRRIDNVVWSRLHIWKIGREGQVGGGPLNDWVRAGPFEKWVHLFSSRGSY